MKRLITCVSLVAAATTAAMSATTPAKPHPTAKSAPHATKQVARAKCKVAPADEYFGKLKMSILGIRNTIKDQGIKADIDPEKASSTLGAIALTEDAIHDWQRKYPCDSWLPGTVYALQHFYLKIHSNDGVKHVHATYAWLRHDFPKSHFVQIARREDGEASAVPVPVGAPIAAASAAPSAPGAAPSAAPIAGQAPATPIPGTAPQSVINAMGTPAPTPHH